MALSIYKARQDEQFCLLQATFLEDATGTRAWPTIHDLPVELLFKIVAHAGTPAALICKLFSQLERRSRMDVCYVAGNNDMLRDLTLAEAAQHVDIFLGGRDLSLVESIALDCALAYCPTLNSLSVAGEDADKWAKIAALPLPMTLTFLQLCDVEPLRDAVGLLAQGLPSLTRLQVLELRDCSLQDAENSIHAALLGIASLRRLEFSDVDGEYNWLALLTLPQITELVIINPPSTTTKIRRLGTVGRQLKQLSLGADEPWSKSEDRALSKLLQGATLEQVILTGMCVQGGLQSFTGLKHLDSLEMNNVPGVVPQLRGLSKLGFRAAVSGRWLKANKAALRTLSHFGSSIDEGFLDALPMLAGLKGLELSLDTADEEPLLDGEVMAARVCVALSRMPALRAVTLSETGVLKKRGQALLKAFCARAEFQSTLLE